MPSSLPGHPADDGATDIGLAEGELLYRIREDGKLEDITNRAIGIKYKSIYMHEPAIKAVGIGKTGRAAINRMIETGLGNVGFVAIDETEHGFLGKLRFNKAPVRLTFLEGPITSLTDGKDPRMVSERIAGKSREEVLNEVIRADIVFVFAEMDEHVSLWAAPLVAEIAKKSGAVTIGLTTLPLDSEDCQKNNSVKSAIEAFRNCVDTLIVIPETGHAAQPDGPISIPDRYTLTHEMMRYGVQCVVEFLMSHIFPSDIRDIIASFRAETGRPLTGKLAIGWGSGERRAVEAAQMAISSPLWEVPLREVRNILAVMIGGPETPFSAIHEACRVISASANPNTKILFNAGQDDDMGEDVRLSMVCIYDQ